MERKILLAILSLFIFAGTTTVSAKDDVASFNYELTRDGSPISRDANFVIFTVYSYTKKSKITSDIGKRNAIHGILFKGLPKTEMQGSQPALLKDGSYEKYAEYLDKFFASGEYLQFIEETNKGFQDVIKISSKEYKVGISVKVNVKGLKQKLEKDGIIKDYYDMMMQ
jgi:hypothetical protein